MHGTLGALRPVTATGACREARGQLTSDRLGAMGELWPVIVGGAIGLVGALIGSLTTVWIAAAQSKRDDDRWIRQQRLTAYMPAVSFLRQFEYRASVFFDLMSRVEDSIPGDATAEQIMEFREQYATEARDYYDYLSRIDGELAPVLVVGPDSVRDAVEAFAKGAREKPTAWFNFGRDFPPVVKAMRDAVRVPL